MSVAITFHLPLARSEAHSSIYDLPGADSQRSLKPPVPLVAACGTTVKARRESALVGFVPAWYSAQLGTPSPSGSARSAASGLLTLPKKLVFHSGELPEGRASAGD